MLKIPFPFCLLKPLLLLVSLIAQGVSYGYPENIRFGYDSCTSCHVSPTGGGTLTDYGKAIADEMSTWSYFGEGRTDYGIFAKESDDKSQDWFTIGGDVRYVHMDVKSKDFDLYDRFSMQNDVEAAIHLANNLTLVAAEGIYGKEKKREYRRHYLLFKASDELSVRLGRFYPAYGIMYSDHTLATRRPLGFDQGKETNNAEVAYLRPEGEVILTGSLAGRPQFRDSKEDGVKFASDDESATFLRTAYYLGKRSLVGASYKFGRNKTDDSINRQFGVFYEFALDKSLYALLDVNKKISPDMRGKSAFYNVFSLGKIGYEAYRGVHLYYTHEYASIMSTNGLGIDWFPTSHAEFDLRYKVDQFSKMMLLISHYYL